MVELFINNKKVDLTDDISISFSYNSIDVDEPTADKNSYSKSVELKGTPTNNEIFSDAYDISRNIVGNSFDPKKRVEYVLYNNGDIIEDGYIKLDEINIDGDEITYSITLYGELGNFFYNLMYDEFGDERTLADLHFGFVGIDGEPIDEDTRLCLWDKDYISVSWEALSGEEQFHKDDIHKYLTAAPTYSGKYDDFDNDKVLVKYDDLNQDEKNILEKGVRGISGYTNNGWLLLQGQRDIDEWEINDFRSLYQRPCFKLSRLFEAISDPSNNGGYNVEWDKDIVNSPYYNDAWIILNRLDFENDEYSSIENVLELDDNIWNGSEVTINLKEYGGSRYDFNTSDWINPMINISVTEMIALEEVRKKVYSHSRVYYYEHDRVKNNYVYGFWHYRLDFYESGTYHSSSADYFMGTSDMMLGGFENYFDCGNNGIVYNQINIIPTSEDKTKLHQFEKPIVIESLLPKGNHITFKLVKEYKVISARIGGLVQPTLFTKKDGGSKLIFSCNSTLYNEDENKLTVNGIYDGTRNPNVQNTRLTKRVLFGNESTPFEYLVGFTKMIGAKYSIEVGEKKVKIQLRKNYYDNDVVNLDDDIDWGDTVSVLPTTCEYKWYKYGLETPSTYVSDMYSKKSSEDYGSITVDSGYYFNNDKNDLFEDICYTSAIPYKHSSIYFNKIGLGSIFLTPYLELTYRKNGEETTSKIQGYEFYRRLLRLQDNYQKLCCFDKDNSNVDDITNCLVFLDGFANEKIQLSDNSSDLIELNDSPCFYMIKDDITLKIDVDNYPIFSKYMTDENGIYTDSLDFSKPTKTFIGNFDKYQDGVTIYERYWKNYIEDVYERNSRQVTVKVFLKDKPQNAMRKFYYFKNAMWVISEIVDYDANNIGTTEVTFLKILDKENYLK